MRILNRLPYFAERSTLSVRGEEQRVRAYQIIVWVSINLQDLLDWDQRLPALPAILDTGNNHNLSIGRGQLMRWAGIQPEALEKRGSLRDRGQHIPLHAATLWLHANQAATREPRRNHTPYRIHLRQGIAIYPDENAPRLPVLGLRALTENRLHFSVDGRKQLVWLRTPDWRAGLLRLLS